MIYLDYDSFVVREGDKLPLNNNGDIDTPRVMASLEDASGIVRTYLPELTSEDGSFVSPPPRLADSLKPIVRDLALYYLTDMGGEERAEKRFKAVVSLLKALGSDGDGELEPIEDSNAELVQGVSQFKRSF